MPARFSIPPDTRSVGTGDPPGDMNKIVDALSAWGYPYHICNTAWAGGAPVDGTSDCTAAVQACMNAAAAAGFPVFIPAGVQFCVSQLTWNAGQVIRGVYAGTYPGSNSITTTSLLARLASTNLDLITVPDGTNYGAICDVAIDGNKNNNSAGRGIAILDGASGQECQISVIRCYFHDNPGSNVYLGHNRRANRVLDGVFNYSGADGITVAGSDNTIKGNICGSNTRGGIVLGTTATVNWAAAASPNAAAVAHVSGNDTYQNQVGIAVAAFSSDNTVYDNGIDRNTLQGVTVHDGASNSVTGNSFHSNGTAANNTYGHIDVAAGVVQVNIAGNNFGPLDGGISNVASYGVAAASGAPAGCITGNIGVIDSTATVGGLINLPAKMLAPAPDGFITPDTGYLAWNFDVGVSSNGTVPGSGVVNLIRVNIRRAMSVTNVILGVTTLGSTLTSGQNFAGLYAGQTAGAYTAGQLIGTSADQTAAFGSTGLKTIPLTGGPFALPAGTFAWVAVVSNGTTPPALFRSGSLNAPAMNAGFAAATARWATNGTATTALPGSITPSSNTLAGVGYWAALS
jgi:parallel beta-helix repeat protein